MKSFRSHFALSRSQQNGIFVLIFLIIALQVFLLCDFSSETDPDTIPESQLEAFQRELDSLNNSDIKRKDTLYPFNPNYITDAKAYELGMSVEEIDRLLEYRKAGKWINSPEDFQIVTGVSDSLLKVIALSFRFPEWTQRTITVSNDIKKTSETVSQITDLNTASAEDLILVNGVGEVLSKRIVKYRQSIGGFRDHIQLQDVYGLSPEVVNNILQKFQILTRPEAGLKDLNSITVGELAELPYFNYGLAQKVVTYRRLHEGITSFEELSKIDGFPSDKIDRIKLYLAIK